MALSPIKLGLVFTGWGIFVAIFAVFGAPRLQASLGIARTIYANVAAFAVVVLVIAIWTTGRAVLIPAVIMSGIFIGVNNTVTTQAVMTEQVTGIAGAECTWCTPRRRRQRTTWRSMARAWTRRGPWSGLIVGGDHHGTPRSAPSWASNCCLRSTPPA